MRDGIAVTSVARTLLDIAAVVQPRQLERAVEQAERLAVFDLRAVERLMDRSRGRAGMSLLRAVIRLYLEPAPTRSELERRFLELCRHADLPPPATNVVVAGFEVDVVWHEQKLIVELDGHAFHRTRAAFERDRMRDAKLQLAGYRVYRVTYHQLESDAEEVIETVRSLLIAGGARARRRSLRMAT
jgi:hypothetical protein